MKRSLSLLLVLALLCALLAGCAGKAACPPASDGGNQEPSPKTEGAVARCRVVAVGEGKQKGKTSFHGRYLLEWFLFP